MRPILVQQNRCHTQNVMEMSGIWFHILTEP